MQNKLDDAALERVAGGGYENNKCDGCGRRLGDDLFRIKELRDGRVVCAGCLCHFNWSTGKINEAYLEFVRKNVLPREQ